MKTIDEQIEDAKKLLTYLEERDLFKKEVREVAYPIPTSISEILIVEDGSCNVDDLKKQGYNVIVYRQGSKPPYFIEDKRRRNETFDEQIENAKKLLEYLEEQKANECGAVTEAEPEMPKMWMPDVEQTYYCIGFDGDVCSTPWYADSHDIARYAVGNVYGTNEEGDFEVERRKVEHELRKYIYEHGGGNGEFGEDRNNYYIWYDHQSKILNTFCTDHIQTIDVFSNSCEVLYDAIQAIGEDRIKKYYLRVKE